MDEHGTGSGKEVSISQYDSESLDKEKRRAILRAEIKHDLETNPRYKELFDQYSPYSVQSFIDHYVWKKESCLTLGDFFLRDESDNLLRFETEGAELMWQIQHKKLFDLECLWRAEQIKIAEVEQTWDFRYWEDHLERCPFLPPITEDEIDTYVDYLMSDLYEDYPTLDWDTLRYRAEEWDEGDLEYPQLYVAFDLRYGTPGYLKLPDKRGEKEKFYCDLVRSKDSPTGGTPATPVKPEESKPSIQYNDLEFMENFVRKFEDEKFLRYFHAMERFDQRNGDDDLDEAISLLKLADEPVPMEDANDWREAIEKTAEKFRRRKLADGVRSAYRGYLIRQENKLFVEEEDKERIVDNIRKRMKAKIIRGRVLNGEPPDLNF